MTAVGESDFSLAAKCLDFCQALAGQGLAFNFSLTISSTFSFSLDTRGKGPALVNKGKTKKRSSPSTLRRNARRRAAFLQRKQNRSPVKPSEVETGTNALSCDMCEFKPASEKGLRQHKRMKHGLSKLPSTVATPERPRQQPRASGSLSASPLLDTNREEPVESEEESEESEDESAISDAYCNITSLGYPKLPFFICDPQGSLMFQK